MKKNLTYSILTIIAVLIFTVLQNFLKISFRNSGIIAIIIIISGTVFIEAKFAGRKNDSFYYTYNFFLFINRRLMKKKNIMYQ